MSTVAGGASPRAGRLLRATFGLALVLLALVTGPSPSQAATFTVTNLDDAGAGSLRHAITDANANAPGVPDVITFTVAGTIVLLSDLPAVSASVVIDGATGPGVVTLAGFGGDCLLVSGDDVTVSGMSVGGCNRGILVTGDRASIIGNHLGVDAAGATATPNITGLEFAIGADDGLVQDNVVSGNSDGIRVASAGVDIVANLIGLGADGVTDMGNDNAGVLFLPEATGAQVGGTTSADRNVISGNGSSDFGAGIFVAGDGVTVANHVIEGNYVGTDASGTVAIANFRGIVVQTNVVTIGGTAAGAGNVVSGNGVGIDVSSAVIGGPGVVIQGNVVGLAAGGTATVPNLSDGIALQGSNHQVAGNVVSGNAGAGIRANDALSLVVEGNFVGTDATFTLVLGNGDAGITVGFSDTVTIGGTTPASGNVVVGNPVGISVNGGTGAVVGNNVVGTNAAGATGFGNGRGVVLEFTTSTQVTGNTVVASATDGVEIFFGTSVLLHGNFLGTTPAGTSGLGNVNGVLVHGFSASVEIGTGVLGTGTSNRIAGNSGAGVTLLGGGDTPIGVNILGNSISDNGGLGIDLVGDGVTPNDAGDGDAGPNELQNFPVLTSVVSTGPGSAEVSGTISSTPNTELRLDFYASATGDPSGFGEGETPVATVGAVTDVSGDVSFTQPVTVPVGEPFFTATATTGGGSTSEFSNWVFLIQPATITTVASGPVTVGGSITDTATVTGVSPTGTVVFRLYGPGDPTCAAPPVFISAPVALVGGTATSPAFVPADPGTYLWIADYSGDAQNGAASGLCGDANESSVVSQAVPVLTTTATPASTTLGGSVQDVATLAGGAAPGGTVTFRLYSDVACTTQAFISEVAVILGTATSTTYTPTAAGTYRWVASYSGDVDNAPVTGACGDPGETLVVGPVTPTISTVASAGVTVGGTVTDTATLAGGASPTGTITFRLYGPADPTCAGPPIFTDTQPVVAAGATSAPLTTTAPGTYRWIANYSGDANNAAAAGACNDPGESVVVAQATPTIATVASAGVTVGGAVTDTATLSGAVAPTGTITFRLYGPADSTCAGPPVFIDVQPLVGAGATSGAFTTTAPGTYRWIASYSGDANNAAVAGACNDPGESVVVAQASPTISTVASPGVTVGGAVTDTATIAGAVSPTGTIIFRLYGPADPTCAGPPVFTDTQPVAAGGATSAPFTTTAPGTYRWIASYSGDANNAAVTGACNDPGESVVVAQATPTISTVASPGVTVGGAVTDTATLAGAASPTGTITFRLYGPNDAACAGPPVFTNTQPVAAGGATSAAFTTTAPGTYRWIANYSGDANNAAVAGACNDPGESVVVAQATPTIATVASAGVTVGGAVTDTATLAGAMSPTGTITFRLHGPNDTACAGPPVFTNTQPVAAGGSTSAPFTTTAPGTYRWIASYSGDANNAAAAGACNDPGESVVVAQATPTISTVASGGVTVGGAVTDTATLAGGATPTGTITFRLYGPTDPTCAGVPIFTNTQPVAAGGATSAPFTTTAPGTYRWIASYSGDANNAAVAGACNDPGESVVVGQAIPTVSTVASAGVPVGGTVTDTATLAGGASPTGTITFRLYGPNDATCAGPAVFTNTQPVAAGGATSAPFTATFPGTYRWIASYSGDANNAAVAGACNDPGESVVVGQATPTISTSASAGVPVGGTVTDTATLAGGASPTGTITFRLYGPNDATCAGPAVFTNTQPVAAGGATSAPFTTTAPGTYRWIASYSGDANNAAVAGACNDPGESVVVGQATPTISTVASAGVPVGGNVTDTATLAGGASPTGTITFRLYGPNDSTCAGPPVFTDTQPVAAGGATSAPFSTTAPGTYRWIASYSGDANNAAAGGACNDPNENVVVSALPTTTTTTTTLPPTTTSTSTTVPPTSTSTTSTSTSTTSTSTTLPPTSTSVPPTSTTSTSSTTSTTSTTTTLPPSTTSTSTSTSTTSTTEPPATTTTSTTAPPTTSTSTPTTTSPSTTTSTSTTTTSTTLPPPGTTTTSSTSTTTTTEPPDDPPVTEPEETTTSTAPVPSTAPAVTSTSQPTTTVPPASTTSTAPPTPPVGTTVAPAAGPIITTPTTPTVTATSLAAVTSVAPATSTPPATQPPPSTPTTVPPPPAPPTHPSPAATVDALSPTGARTGPPGVGLDVSGAGYSDCRVVYVFFDGQRVGTVRPDAGGTIDGGGFSVPGDASPGSHDVTTSCQSSGKSVRATTTFMVTASSMHRSGFVTAIPQPGQISLELDALATSAIAALLLLLLFAFPYELFNSTVEENYDEIRGWFRLPARAAAVVRTKARTVGFFVLNLAAAAVYGFLSPDFGLNMNSLVLLLGMFVALLTMSAVFSLPAAVVIHRRFGEWGKLNFLPGSLGISIAMVVMSRLLEFQPGYVYGAMAGLAFKSALAKSSQGRLTAANWFFSLLLAIGAWFARVPVSEASAQPDASVWWMGVEVCLALIFLWGIESLAVAMLPMRFLDGRKVIDWNRPMWAVLMFVGAFVTVHVLLSASSGYVGQTGGQVRFAVLMLFLGFGAFSVSVWGYFRYRPQRWAPPTS